MKTNSVLSFPKSLKVAFVLSAAAVAAACVHKQAPLSGFLSDAGSGAGSEALSEIDSERTPASPKQIRSGYLVSEELCGQGDLKFPRLPIDTRKGYCVGLVASKEQGLLFPRTIEQIPGKEDFIVVDMGGWKQERDVKTGKVWLLERFGASYKLRVLIDQLDQPHGLQFGPDKKPYVATMKEIFRFDPYSPRPEQTIEYVIRGLQGRAYKHEDGTVYNHNAHPLKHFIFDSQGHLYVNVGAPSDACATSPQEAKPCKTSEGSSPSAAIWKFKPQVAGQPFKPLKATDKNPAHEILATGLRNSMALAMHPKYPEPGYAFLQGENSRDLKDPSQPHEELNSIEAGKHYGWPYCYNVNTESEEYRDFLSKPGQYQKLCSNPNLYRAPYSVLPPHSAPLGMMYYQADRFAELKKSLVISWHGYLAAGNRIAFAPVDDRGFPIRQAQPTTYKANCVGERISTAEDKSQINGVQFQELVTGWYPVVGLRPIGAPVGMTVASDGAIWVVEDKNQTILRIDVDPSNVERPMAPCDQRTEDEIKELLGYIAKDSANQARLRKIRTELVEKHCISCHTGFNLKPEHADPAVRDRVVAEFMMNQDGWITPNDIKESHLFARTHALPPAKPMPGNATELLKDENYRQLIGALDHFMDTLVPGERAETTAVIKIRNQNKEVCGSLPMSTKVIVLEKKTLLEKFSRVYAPSRKYMSGPGWLPVGAAAAKCQKTDKWYVGSDFLKALPARQPQSESGVKSSSGDEALSQSATESQQAQQSSALFESKQLTEKGAFTFGIEGPAVSQDGTLYVVNFQKQGTIGRVDGQGKASLLVTLPEGSVGNSIRFDRQELMYIADYKGHNIYTYDLKSKELKVFAHNADMAQPNDLTIAADGTIYASDPNWKKRSGSVWQASVKGDLKKVADKLGTVNGIDLSPDDSTLYVGESGQGTVWAFKIVKGELEDRRQVIRFKGEDIDGIRTDVDGNIYVARIGKGLVAKVSPKGELLKEIKVTGPNPTNLAFGGPDGKTVFVTQRAGGYVETFRVDSPGREWAMLHRAP